MGILAENLEWLFEEINPQLSMLELGNQFLYIPGKPWASFPEKYIDPSGTQKKVAKYYFQELGYDHTSVDLNGQDGTIQADLSLPIFLNRKFDVITDFGTSEHVPSLYNCLLNVHNHAKDGAKLCHINPLTGHWPGHGYWYRDEDFYIEYAKITGYKIIKMKKFPACGNYVDGWNIWCFLEKSIGSTFPTEEEFNKLPIKTK